MALAFILVVSLVVAFVSMKPTLVRESADRRFHPLGVEEIEAGLGRLESDALPMVSLEPTEGDPAAKDTRLGGAAWTPDQATSWPVDQAGRAYVLVAQLNFADLLAPDDFPDHGILQIFVRHDGTGMPLAGMDATDDEALMTRWFPNPDVGFLLAPPTELTDLTSGMLASSEVRNTGVRLCPVRRNLPANPFSWPYLDDVFLNLTKRRPANDMAAQMQNGLRCHFDRILNAYGGHWLGGYPNFIREDIRRRQTALRSLDRVLLHVGFDKHICIGDAGTLNILISQNDLRHRRFDRAYFTSEKS